MVTSTNSYKYLVFGLFILLFIINFITPPSNALSWDAFGYYLYLPAKFIYHDIALHDKQWLDLLIAKYQPTGTFYQATLLENGNWVMKYSMGCALLYAPFFFIAHAIAGPLGYAADGFSLPYQYSILIGGLIYTGIGLYFLGKVLRTFFNNGTTILLILIIFFGTNYFQLTAFGGTILSHSFLFTFYAILAYYTIQWHNKPKLWYAIVIGGMIGIITLVRPTEIICCLIPLLWGIKDRASFKAKLHLIKQHWGQIATVALVTILVGVPQLLYWKRFTGHYLFFSYTNPGEGLDFLNPHTYKFLLSFRKGWFIYTPVMLFAIVGFNHLYKNKREIFYPLFLFFVLDVYLMSTWTNWWYADGSYSSRSIMPAYVLLAFPLGYFIQWLKSSSRNIKLATTTIISLLVLLNLFQTWQFQNGIISKERMTRAYYFSIFGKTSVDAEDEKLLLVNRSTDGFEYLKDEENYTHKILYENRFEESIVDSAKGEKGMFAMNEQNPYSPGIDIKYKDLTTHNHAWLRTRVKVMLPDSFAGGEPLLVATFHHNEKAYKYMTSEFNKGPKMHPGLNTLTLDYLTPEVRSTNDNVKIYVWYTGKQPILVDDLTIELFEPKVEY